MLCESAGVRLRDDVDATLDDNSHHYVLPFDQDDAFDAFSALEDALWSLKSFATNDEGDDLDSALVYTRRRFARVFSPAYDTKDIKTYKLPTHGEIHSDITWYGPGDVPARTITIEKTEEHLYLTYEDGFHNADEELHLSAHEVEEKKGDAVHNCGKGIKAVHTPYRPGMFEKWRYRPSRVQFSFARTDNGLRLGLTSDAPSAPLWYSPYKYLSMMGGPYAHATFSLDDQTSTVKYVRDYDG